MKNFKEGDFTVVSRPCVEDGEKGFVVGIFATPQLKVDRPHIYSWLVKEKIAPRLVKCIEKGLAFTGYEIKKDIHGQTYVWPNCVLNHRHLRRNLINLGC